MLAGRTQLLEPAECGAGGELLGAIDLDGDGRLELVTHEQHQFIIYRLDGSIALKGPPCCPLG